MKPRRLAVAFSALLLCGVAARAGSNRRSTSAVNLVRVPHGGIQPEANPIAAPGTGAARKHPRLAIGTGGDTLLVWTEGTAWARGGGLAWRIFDAAGQPSERSGRTSGVPVWSFAGAVARRDGGFMVLY